MTCSPSLRTAGAAAVALTTLAGTASAQLLPTGTRGPSTQQDPYMLAAAYNGVRFVSIASNGNGTTTANEQYGKLDASGNVVAGANYRMVGIPDGLGAYANPGGNSFELVMNHELGATSGIVRDHGSRGAFVSRWTINNDLSVVGGRDQNTQYNLYNISTNSYQAFNSASPMPNYAPGTVNGVQGWDNNNPSRNGINRYCSADLAEQSAFSYTDANGQTWGTSSRIFLNGEESGAGGRAIGHVLDQNQTFELPRLGSLSFENVLANPFAQKKTIAISMDDGSTTDSNLYVYVGEKQQTGNAVERAGLTNGNLYAVTMSGTSTVTSTTRQSTGGTTNDLPSLTITRNVESQANVFGTSSRVESKAFGLYNLGDTTATPGSQFQVPGTGGTGQPPATFTGQLGIQQIGDQNGQMNFGRTEDGAWDPANPNRYYFVTTGSFGAPSRIFAMDFADISNPTLGGTVTMLGDGQVQSSFSGGFTSYDSFDRSSSVSATGKAGTMEMADNMTAVVGRDGVTRLLIQEDVGGNDRLGRLWLYDTAADSLLEVGVSDARLFGRSSWIPGVTGTNFLTNDEETSGIIPAPWLGDGWFLLDMQAHYSISGELVEGGQLLAVYIPQTIPAPTGAALLGLAGLVAARRRR